MSCVLVEDTKTSRRKLKTVIADMTGEVERARCQAGQIVLERSAGTEISQR